MNKQVLTKRTNRGRRKLFLENNYGWLAAVGLIWLLLVTDKNDQKHFYAFVNMGALISALIWVVIMEIFTRKIYKLLPAVFVGFDSVVGFSTKGNPLSAASLMVFEADGKTYNCSAKSKNAISPGDLVYIEVGFFRTILSYQLRKNTTQAAAIK